MSNKNENVASRLKVNLKASASSEKNKSVIKPLAHKDTEVSLDANRTPVLQGLAKPLVIPRGRSIKPKSKESSESTSTGFIMDAPGVFGVGFDGSMMEMFNKPDFKD